MSAARRMGVAESFMAWAERESNTQETDTGQALVLDLVIAATNKGALSGQEYCWLSRRIESNRQRIREAS